MAGFPKDRGAGRAAREPRRGICHHAEAGGCSPLPQTGESQIHLRCSGFVTPAEVLMVKVDGSRSAFALARTQ